MSPLEDSKSGVELSAARNVALDYLGDIAARIRSSELEVHREGAHSSLVEVRHRCRSKLTHQIISSADVDAVSRILRDQTTVQTYLATSARDDGMFAVRPMISALTDLAEFFRYDICGLGARAPSCPQEDHLND